MELQDELGKPFCELVEDEVRILGFTKDHDQSLFRMRDEYGVRPRGQAMGYAVALWFLLGAFMVKKGLDDLGFLQSERASRTGCLMALAVIAVLTGMSFWYAPG